MGRNSLVVLVTAGLSSVASASPVTDAERALVAAEREFAHASEQLAHAQAGLAIAHPSRAEHAAEADVEIAHVTYERLVAIGCTPRRELEAAAAEESAARTHLERVRTPPVDATAFDRASVLRVATELAATKRDARRAQLFAAQRAARER